MKSEEQYKEEFIDRASAGYLLKVWRQNRFNYQIDYCEIVKPDGEFDWITSYSGFVRAYDAVWSKQSGESKWLIWPANEFKTHLDTKKHFVRKFEGKQKRQYLANKYKKGGKG